MQIFGESLLKIEGTENAEALRSEQAWGKWKLILLSGVNEGDR